MDWPLRYPGVDCHSEFVALKVGTHLFPPPCKEPKASFSSQELSKPLTLYVVGGILTFIGFVKPNWSFLKIQTVIPNYVSNKDSGNRPWSHGVGPEGRACHFEDQHKQQDLTLFM